jgi:hypothetical protein
VTHCLVVSRRLMEALLNPMPFEYSAPSQNRAEKWKNRQFRNPKGIVSSSPGLRGTSYPGLASVWFSTPTGLLPLAVPGPQPRWGWPTPPAFPRVARGSQPWALGRNPFGIQLWNFREALLLDRRGAKSAARRSRKSEGGEVLLRAAIPFERPIQTQRREERSAAEPQPMERGHSCPLGGRKQSNGQESLRGHCRTERRKDRWFGNPKGIVSSSPAAESARLPWVSIRAILNPNDSAPSPPTGHNRWGWPTPPAFPWVARGSQPWALGRNPFGIL